MDMECDMNAFAVNASVGMDKDLAQNVITLAMNGLALITECSKDTVDTETARILDTTHENITRIMEMIETPENDEEERITGRLLTGMSNLLTKLSDCSYDNLSVFNACIPNHFNVKSTNTFNVVKNSRKHCSDSSDNDCENDDIMVLNENIGIRNRKSKKRATQSAVGQAYSEHIELTLKNKYSPLEPEDNQMVIDKDRLSKLNEIENQTENVNDNSDSNQNKVDNNAKTKNNPPRIRKPDPFWIQKESQDWRKIIADLNQLCNTQLNLANDPKFIKVRANDEEQFRTIQRYLTQKQIKAFANNPRSERPIKILIKRLPAEIPISEVKEELSKKGYYYTRVGQLKNFTTKQPLDIFIINLTPNENASKIYEEKTFLGFDIKIESYTFKGTKQCYRCQNFFHSSEVCNLDPRCLRCGEGHMTNECKYPKTQPRKCANCGEDHSANYKGCKFHPDNPNFRKKPKNIRNFRPTNLEKNQNSNRENITVNQTQTNPSNSNSNTIPKNISYADSVKNPNVNQNSENSEINNFLKNLREIHSLLSGIKQLCNDLKITNVSEILSAQLNKVQNTH
jgi:PAX-interacting protein 1